MWIINISRDTKPTRWSNWGITYKAPRICDKMSENVQIYAVQYANKYTLFNTKNLICIYATKTKQFFKNQFRSFPIKSRFAEIKN